MSTERVLEKRYPAIAWREPIQIATPTACGLGCRYCIAIFGLAAHEVAHLPQTVAEFASHLEQYHPRRDEDD